MTELYSCRRAQPLHVFDTRQLLVAICQIDAYLLETQLETKIFEVITSILHNCKTLDTTTRKQNENKMSENSTNDEYAHVAKGPLKLKCDPAAIKKKKKKKQKEKQIVEMAKIIEEEKPKSGEPKRTKAELAFQKMQEKMQTERIKQKASMTHKQRVEEFNRHLDSLTEHFDIPKVSWTK